MPQVHTDLFNNVTNGQANPPIYIHPQIIQTALEKKTTYSEIADLLREVNDAQFGIVSKLNNDGEWVRDATASIELKDRISHDHPVLEANNALLRCLSRLRPIDYAIGKKLSSTAQNTQDKMREEYANLISNVLSISQNSNFDDVQKRESIKKAEKEFNTLLVKHLHEANLARGCETADDAEKLLFHYRNLSSVLDEARTLVTLTYDEKAKIFQRETQYPVTKKTEAQRAAINKLKTIDPHPKEKDSHTSHKLAMQEADSIFADKIGDQSTALSAQARKTHLVGAKNAFIVKNELIPIEEELPVDTSTLEATKNNTLWLGRTGSPVFTGKGENDDDLQFHTQQNLEQIRREAEERMGASRIHLTTLNTFSPHEKQSKIVSQLYAATREREGSGDDISYAPTNDEGTLRRLDVSPVLGVKQGIFGGISGGQKANRLESVSQIMLAAAKKEETISLVNCASGQDRTGTAVEKTTQDWMKERYKELGKDHSNIDSMRARGGNAAEITTHHIHGSPGMKEESKANNYFDSKTTFTPEATREFYRKSAGTNKKNSVDDVSFLKTPTESAKKRYEESLKSFQQALEQNNKKGELCLAGRNVMNQIEEIAKLEPGKFNELNELNELSDVFDASRECLEQLNKPAQMKEHVKKLLKITTHVSENKNTVWQKLGLGLAFFACAALVVVGALAAIPTGGLSILVSAAGAAAAGGIATHAARDNALSSSIKSYKEQLEKIEQMKGGEDTPESQQKNDSTIKPS